VAVRHFEGLGAFETDCADVHTSMATRPADFVLVDVRSQASFELGHIGGAVHLPHGSLTEDALAVYADDTLFVVYCAGPHCNAADQAALRLARLGRPVKKMIGGVQGWTDEGYDLASLLAAPC